MRTRDLSSKREDEAQQLRIFVSYRREDTGGHAGRLYDALAARFGPENVFMDIDTIDLGADFAGAINRAVASFDVVIALIGRGWLDATHAEGGRRLDDPADFLRLELEAALARDDVVVIPTCVEGAAIPAPELLPPSLAALPGRQGIELRHEAWHDDVERLIRRLNRLTGDRTERQVAVSVPARSPRLPRLWRSRRAQVAGVLVLAALGGLAAAIALAFDGSGGGDSAGGAPRDRLLAAIPLEIRSNCTPISWGPKSALVSLECSGERTTVDYHLFPSDELMDTWYALQRERAFVEPGEGECSEEEFEGESSYEGGLLLCYLEEGFPELVASDSRVSVGLEVFIQEKGPAAERSVFRQWGCCLRTRPT